MQPFLSFSLFFSNVFMEDMVACRVTKDTPVFGVYYE